MSKYSITPLINNFRHLANTILQEVADIIEVATEFSDYTHCAYSRSRLGESDTDDKKSVDSETSAEKVLDFKSKLSKIKVAIDGNPLTLFGIWLKQTQDRTSFLYAHTMNLATVSASGHISSRNVVMTALSNDELHFTTSTLSQKSKDINAHPQVALTFIWFYPDDNKQIISRQIRIDGDAIEKDENYSNEAFAKASIHNKFRSCLTYQSSEVDWHCLKRRHDGLLKIVQNQGVNLEKPVNIVSYKVIPQRFEFYHNECDDATIADRVLYTKTDVGEWKHVHLEA